MGAPRPPEPCVPAVQCDELGVSAVFGDVSVVHHSDLIRGQFRGYREEPGVAPQSNTETFVALRLSIDSWRWQNVPFFIRAGKLLPTTATEVLVRLRPPPDLYPELGPPANYLRFRIGPDIAIAMGASVLAPGSEMHGNHVELLAAENPTADDQLAYERVLSDALAGDASIFAREDYVEEAWRIVDPVLRDPQPVVPYSPKTWGPVIPPHLTPPGGWCDPGDKPV